MSDNNVILLHSVLSTLPVDSSKYQHVRRILIHQLNIAAEVVKIRKRLAE